MASSVTFEQAMQHAIALARRGTGYVSPNPRVGCVIVHDGTIIGEGWHRQFGGPHAEIEALRACPTVPDNSTLVVTLEPCSHTGKTPPCADAIINSGINHVVIGCVDPNPQVAGRGIQRLRNAGIRVDVGLCQAECEDLIRAFTKYMTHHKPYVTLKLAQSLDGSITSASGKSRWITGEASRHAVQKLRAEHDAILVGVGTIVADDPLLTVRDLASPSPRRFIIDPHLRTPTGSKVVSTADTVQTTIITTHVTAKSLQPYRDHHVRVVELPFAEGRLHIPSLLDFLHSDSVTSLLVEGGAATASAFLEADAVDELRLHIAPILLGNSPRWYSATVPSPSLAHRWKLQAHARVDSDIHLTYRR